ncbi:MAG: hypothetical protein IAE91_10145 [Ignavibacteriaceae bacterium]|nr:hypothetical protein [Ignavibacteriaceae bacterium]
MTKINFLLFLLLFILPGVVFAQENSDPDLNKYKSYGTVIFREFDNSPFPHEGRAKGYRYGRRNYPAKTHYSDPKAFVFIPDYYKPLPFVDIIIHFHGWRNSVKGALEEFKLVEQLHKSRKNAILIVPQGPKFAPDSFYGKLEEDHGFQRFIDEILIYLEELKLVNSLIPGRIIISGHSGAYRVISLILTKGGLTGQVREVYIFDGMYGRLEEFTEWIEQYDGKFINIYAEKSGTKKGSEELLKTLEESGISFVYRKDTELTEEDLLDYSIVIVYTSLSHEDVIHRTGYFFRFLTSSCLEE